MGKIFSYYNQNKKIIWIVILTVIAVISLIQVFNNYYKNKAKDESSSANNSTTTYNTNTYSVITQKDINEHTAQESDNLIKSFFDYCNNGEIEEAYNMLSTDCKEELYPTVNEFKEKYYNKIFTERRSYDTVLWINTNTRNTYRVEIMADLLATGQKDYMPIEDYYTVIIENEEYKLNISGYIGKKDVNISNSQNGINLTIVSRKIYMEYEKYEIKIENNTGSRLIFNTKQNTNSIYINDENGLQYISFLNELSSNELEILNGMTKTFNIRFNRGYKPSIDIKRIVFEDIKINNNEQTETIEIEM